MYNLYLSKKNNPAIIGLFFYLGSSKKKSISSCSPTTKMGTQSKNEKFKFNTFHGTTAG